MKGMFPEYDVRAGAELNEAWKHGLFVFDTNVLLNLYRYQEATRSELINVLDQLSERIWIPYQVALEFQRNRLTVIAEQNGRFSEVQKAVEKARTGLFADLDRLQLKKRHYSIDPQPLIDGFDKLATQFLSDLEQRRQQQLRLTEPDPLKAKIESLFDGRVGGAPASQQALDQIYAEADSRFKLKIPPGYRDSDKGAGDLDHFSSRGVIFRRSYGDYVVWWQTLAHVKNSAIKHLIFVTDDGKDDWWHRIESDGPKTIGPRPELIDESRSKASVDVFLMYNPEGFLKYANEFLKTPVSQTALNEVRDVSAARTVDLSGHLSMAKRSGVAQKAVFDWLCAQFGNVERTRAGFPDFKATRDGKWHWYEVKFVRDPIVMLKRLVEVVDHVRQVEDAEWPFECTLVVVISKFKDVALLKKIVSMKVRGNGQRTLKVIIGVQEGAEGSVLGRFIPYEQLEIGGL